MLYKPIFGCWWHHSNKYSHWNDNISMGVFIYTHSPLSPATCFKIDFTIIPWKGLIIKKYALPSQLLYFTTVVIRSSCFPSWYSPHHMDTWKSRCLSGIPRISSCRFLSKTISVNLVAVSSPNGFTIAFLKFMSQPIHLGNRLKARLRKSSGVKAYPVTITLEKESI